MKKYICICILFFTVLNSKQVWTLAVSSKLEELTPRLKQKTVQLSPSSLTQEQLLHYLSRKIENGLDGEPIDISLFEIKLKEITNFKTLLKQDEDGGTLLHTACWITDKNLEYSEEIILQIVKIILNTIPEEEKAAALNIQDYEMKTPLHEASRNGFLKIMRLFLENGASLSISDHSKETPEQKFIRYAQETKSKKEIKEAINLFNKYKKLQKIPTYTQTPYTKPEQDSPPRKKTQWKITDSTPMTTFITKINKNLRSTPERINFEIKSFEGMTQEEVLIKWKDWKQWAKENIQTTQKNKNALTHIINMHRKVYEYLDRNKQQSIPTLTFDKQLFKNRQLTIDPNKTLEGIIASGIANAFCA